MLQPIMARAIAAEIRNTIQTTEAIAGLLEAAATYAESHGTEVEDIYPRACGAALDGLGMQLQVERDKLLENAGITQ
jgi:hypothetical protein